MKPGSRKFIVVSGTMLLSFVLALLSKLSGEFVTIATICVGAFAASNAFEHHVKGRP